MQHVLRLRPVPGASLTLPCGGADSASICSLICLTVASSSATSFFNSCIVKCKFSPLRLQAEASGMASGCGLGLFVQVLIAERLQSVQVAHLTDRVA